jgi:hypothetical protein
VNDKDKEAFDYWIENSTTTQEEIKAYEAMSEKDRVMFCMKYTWKAACEYKEAENKKLREALKTSIEGHQFSRMVLREACFHGAADDMTDYIDVTMKALKEG